MEAPRHRTANLVNPGQADLSWSMVSQYQVDRSRPLGPKDGPKPVDQVRPFLHGRGAPTNRNGFDGHTQSRVFSRLISLQWRLQPTQTRPSDRANEGYQ